MDRHLKQVECFWDEARFKMILAGRRGGKTFLITEDIIKAIHTAPWYGEIFYVGPTNQQAMEIIWESLESRLAQTGWKYTDKISKQRFELSRKRKIYVIGAEKIRRIRGHPVVKAYLDEIAFYQTDLNKVWRAVRPALSDFKGGAIASTTPNGKGTQAYDFYLASLNTPNWKYFNWSTYDNPYIDKDEIEEAKRELDEKSFKQEYMATWESYEGLAYYNFAEDANIIKQAPFTHDDHITKPVHLVFDFNVNPTTLLISQRDRDKLRYIKEYSYKNSSTEQTVEAFCNDHKDHAKVLDLRLRGDSTGKNRTSTTGRSDYYYVEEILKKYGFNYTKEIPGRNPPIIDRVKVVNGWLKPVVGPTRIEIDPSCSDLIRDLSSQELNGRIPSDRNNLGHKADAFGYDIYYEHLVGARKPQRTIEL